MAKKAKGTAKYLLVLFVLCLLVRPTILESYDKKLKVAVDYTHIYFKPDDASPIIDTLQRGAVVSLLYGGKMKKSWYYVCYKSEKTGMTKSGYILDAAVDLLFDPLKTIVISQETPWSGVHYVPRKFEEMTWGQSKKQVLESEGKPLYQEKAKGLDIMEYQQKVNNLDCSIKYIFAANKLSKTKFLFLNNYADKNVYLEDYQKIKESLTQKFGKPLEENMNWKDSTYKDDFSAWGQAIGQGQLELTSRWQTLHTEVLASLRGNNDEIALSVEYSGLQPKERARKGQEE